MLSDEEKKAIEYIENCLDDEYDYKNATRQKDKKAHNIILNLIEKQSKEIEELKDKNKTLKNLQNDTNRLYTEMIERKNYFERELQKSEYKIKAKIGKRMQKNNNTIHNAKLKHGKDYVYYDDVQEAKEENRICKEILQSLLEKE